MSLLTADPTTQPARSRARRRAGTAAVVAIAIILTATGCSAGGSTDDGEAVTTFTVGQAQAPNNLDPALAGPPTYVFPAYSPLIYQAMDGTFVPDLATEWGYLDDQNQEFEITLREGVTFADGDALDAEAVKASLERFLELEGNSNVANAGPVESIEVTGDNTVVIHYSEPFPEAALSLTQDWRFGLIVSPTGIANADLLPTETHGAGQYVLDTDASVTGSEYTFTANENYWNPDAVKFETVVLKVITDSAAQLSALQSGEIDYANNSASSNVEPALADGFVNKLGTGGISMLTLQNRETGPLSDPKVREAISLAIDRDTLAVGVWEGLASPISSIAIDGQLGFYDPEPIEQDIEKAKDLLAEAGYADGLTLSFLTNAGIDPNLALTTALQSQLAEVGITVEINNPTGASDALFAAIYALTDDAVVWRYTNINTYYQFITNLVPSGSLANIAESTDAELNELVAAAGTQTGDDYDAAMQAVAERYDSLNWVVPIALIQDNQLFAPYVENVDDTAVTQSMNGFSPDPDASWEINSK